MEKTCFSRHLHITITVTHFTQLSISNRSGRYAGFIGERYNTLDPAGPDVCIEYRWID